MSEVTMAKTFYDALNKLPKAIKSKFASIPSKFDSSTQSKGLHIEKLSNSELYSARVDDNYRIIFAQFEDAKKILLLYVDTHEKAYRWADAHHLQINLMTGGLDIVKKAPPRIVVDPSTKVRHSRLSFITDKQFVTMNVPEEYWPQLRTKVFSKAQLTAYKGLVSEAAYHTMEYILEGETVDIAMELFESESQSIVPAQCTTKEPFFAAYDDQELAKVGVPFDLIPRIKLIKTETELEIMTKELPLLAAQSLYALHNGSTFEDIQKTSFGTAKAIEETDFEKALANPITLAEFAPIGSSEALQAILNAPAAQWRIFLHPMQQSIIRRDYNGPAQVIGGAGTGKTVVILHRAKRLAGCCKADEKILVTSFTKTLTTDIGDRLEEICSSDEYDHIVVANVDKIASDYAKEMLKLRIGYSEMADIWKEALQATGLLEKYSVDFCQDEFRYVIQEQNIELLEDYIETKRYGRGKQLDRKSREEFWNVVKKYFELCNKNHIVDIDRAENILAKHIASEPSKRYKSILVDECQDLRAPAFRMLRALAGEPHENDLFLSGDSRQRIYKSRTSFSQCGIVINNRSRNLKLNYRTTAEIYDFAFRLQEKYSYDDMNGKSIDKLKNDCIFRGSKPCIRKYATEKEEDEALIHDIQEKLRQGVHEQDICIILRAWQTVNRYEKLLHENGLSVLKCTNQQADKLDRPGVRLMTMHRSKGMEYSYVYLPCLTNKLLPPVKDWETAQMDGTEQDLIVTESNILAVAITRAKRFVWLSYFGEPSMLLSAWR